jgi:DNA-binding MarR family transcriptional regulator
MAQEPRANDAGSDPHVLIHKLREVVVSLDLLGARFARVHDLHPTDVRALILLLDAERAGHPATPGWLGSALGVNSASTTALVDRMQSRDLVSRTRDTVDRRRVLLEVTSTARTLGESFFGDAIGRAVVSMKSLSPSDRRVVDRFLTDVNTAISAE